MTAPIEAGVTLMERDLPADITDQQYMDVAAEFEAELRALGVPANLVRVGLSNNPDGSWHVQGWQAKSAYDWSWPAPAAFQ